MLASVDTLDMSCISMAESFDRFHKLQSLVLRVFPVPPPLCTTLALMQDRRVLMRSGMLEPKWLVACIQITLGASPVLHGAPGVRAGRRARGLRVWSMGNRAHGASAEAWEEIELCALHV